jgi:hypothetical protein
LIEALPPIYDKYDVMKLLTVDPKYNKREREFEMHNRLHCIGRLFRYFQPLDVHFEIEQRISLAIRQSYISKNPATPMYAAGLVQGVAAIRENSLVSSTSANSTAFGFTIIGISGVGKTTAMEKVLSLYPQTILHTQYNNAPMFLTQLVWAKLDCPFDGSLKGLCMSFFAYVDNVLGTDYAKMFSVYRMTVDAALPRMAQIKAIADRTEMVTAKGIKEVAAEKLWPLKKMFDAIRSGDVRKLAQYEDIIPLNVEDYLAAQSARIAVTVPIFSKDEVLSLEEQAILKLLEMDIPSKIARSAAKKAIGKAGAAQPLSQITLKAVKIALATGFEEKGTVDVIAEENDLRKVAGESSYENLKDAGFIERNLDLC